MNEGLWQEVLITASILVPIVTALTGVLKAMFNLKKNFLPVISVVIGLLVGLAIAPFTELAFDVRLWIGGLAGLAGTGFYELAWKSREGTTKE